MPDYRRTNIRTISRFLTLNFFITICISSFYIFFSGGYTTNLSRFFISLALFSNFALIYLALGIILWFTAFISGSKKNVLFTIAIATLSLVHILNFIDVTVYRIFKFHINSMVINLLFTPGAGDSLHLGIWTYLGSTLAASAFFAFEFFLIKVTFRKSLVSRIGWKPIAIAALFIFVVNAGDKGIYAASDLLNKRSVLRHASTFPLYQKMTVKGFMRDHFGYKAMKGDYSVKIDGSYSSLNYPKKALQAEPKDFYPNIIWIFSDAWRWDMFNENLTPHIWDFSKKATVFTDHYSGGYCTRFGVFSAFYGLYGFYWHPFLAERQGPVIIDELKKIGYDFRMIGSASFQNPEFIQTAFVAIPEKTIDNLKGKNAAEKDPLITHEFQNFLEKRDKKQPFFSFLFYDAPHGSFSYPDAYERFKPAIKKPNYLTVREKHKDALKNAYMNAIGFNDDEIGKVLDSVEKTGLLDNTIIIISSDHGEEFYESGYYGHNSAFSMEQTKIPLILYVPGMQPSRINYMTSHLDIVPTLLELIGYTTEPSVYCQGKSLFDGKGHDFTVSSGWDTCAVIKPEAIVHFSFETYNLGTFEVRDRTYRLVENADMSIYRSDVMQVLKGFNEFRK
ncbi:MAG: sulfatase-like hydrolase/transferase [Desulfobacterales bacterium]|nr:sulfatase-like hydrolase/transferase [Desulfobacterales bacterium]